MREEWPDIVAESDKKLVLVFFTGTGCVPCARLKKDMRSEGPPADKVVVYTLDCWADPEAQAVASVQNIKQVPTLILLKNRRVAAMWQGYKGPADWKGVLQTIYRMLQE